MKERYSLEQAQKEAEEIKNIVKYRGVKNYNEAEELHVIHLLNYGKVSDSALDHLSENFLRSPEAQIAAINGFYNLVNSGELGSALTIRNKFGISDEIIKSYEKFSVSMIKGIRRCDSHEAIIEFKNQIQLPKDILQKAAEERMLSYLEFPNFWCHNFESRTHEKAWIEKEICENFFYSQRFIEDFKNIISDIATSMVTDKFFLGPKPLVLELLKLFNLQNDFLESPEIQKNLTHTLFIFLKGRSYDDVMFFTHNFLTRDTLQSEKVKEKAIGLAQQCFQYGYGDEQRQFTHHASAKDLNVFKIGLEGYLDNLLQKSNFDEVLKFINQIPRNESLIKKILLFLFNSEDYENNIRGFKFLSERSDLQNISQVKEVARKSIINILKHDGSRAVMLYTNDEFDLYDDEFEKSPEVQTAIKEGVVLLVRRKDFGTILALSETFQAHFDAKLGTIFALNNQEGLVARSDFTLDDTPFIHEVMNALDFDSIPRQIVSSKEFKEFAYNYLLSEDKNNDELAIQALTARLDTPLSPQEYLNINLANPAFEGPEASPKLIIEELEKLLRTEGEDNTIADFLKLGVERFGSETMLQYMNRPDLSRHDALYFIPTILKLQEQSGLTPAQFGSNILLQVAKDGALYEGNSAHHFFATVSTALEKTSPQEIIQKIQKYSNVETLQELAKDVESGQSFFSWKNLKKLYEVNQLLGRTKIMDELNQGDISPRLRAFVEKLAFHPNISTEAVIQFWKQPAHFLDIDDVHTAENINRVKKPRNLLSLPFLDLTAEDLRDALVEGDLDDLQDLPPMEQNYYFGIPSREEVAGDPSILHHALREAIGERKKNIQGAASNIPKLFSEIRNWCKSNNLTWEELWNADRGKDYVAKLSPKAQGNLLELIYDKNIGIRGKQDTFQVYRARIGKKSDPDMVVAGNDTACCMPFGSGKNNVYMFNPLYAQMVVERLTNENKWRTAAQSVMSIDHKASTPTPDLMKAYLEEGQHLTDLVKPGDLEGLPSVTCDNIEPAKNEEGQRSQYLRDVYQKFFTQYLEEFADKLQVRKTEIPIGTGYTPAGLGFEEVTNTYIPQAPAGYSDNIHENCFIIKTGLSETEQKIEPLAPLCVRDAISVAVLEGKAYSDNTSLLESLHKMQNNLIGMSIANRHFNRPNLSFMYRDKNGTPRGYMLAFEGRKNNSSFVFIDDLASDRENPMTGGRLIKKFFDTYASEYGTDERPYLPIFTNARDTTSFPIIEHNAEKMAKAKGLKAKVVEVGTHYRGNDLMHDVVILIGKTQQQLDEQEKIMRLAFSSHEDDENEDEDYNSEE